MNKSSTGKKYYAKQDGSKVSKNDLLLLLKVYKTHFKILPQFQKLSDSSVTHLHRIKQRRKKAFRKMLMMVFKGNLNLKFKNILILIIL